MKVFMSLLVSCCLGLSWVSADCPGWSEEKLAQLKALTVAENIHDNMAGDFTVLYAAKLVAEADPKGCAKIHRVKIDDTRIAHSVLQSNTWFGGEKYWNHTLEIVENGLHKVLSTEQDGFVKGDNNFLYFGKHVEAKFSCLSYIPKPGSKDSMYPGFVSVSVRTEYMKTPLDAAVQAEVDAAVKLLQEHKDLVGEIAPYANPTC